MDPDREEGSELTFGKVSGLSIGVLGALCVLWVCWHEDDVVTSLLGLVGGALGWLTGILVVPLSAKEEKQFDVLAKVISGFVTGYLLSKIDPLITALITIPVGGRAAITEPVVATRCLVTIASYLIAVLMVFCARTYWSKSREASDARKNEENRIAHSAGQIADAAAKLAELDSRKP